MKTLSSILITAMVLISFTCLGQDEKTKPILDITYFRTDGELPYIKVRVRKRPDRRYVPMEGIFVQTYFNEISDETKLREVVTNAKGEATVEMPDHLMQKWHGLDEFQYIATITATDSTEEAEETLDVKKARLKLKATKDSTLIAVLEKKDSAGWLPVQYVQVIPFVKRSFGRLLLSDDYLPTDAAGKISLKYDMDDVPGDEEGNLLVGGMVQDHDEFGNLTSYLHTKWGVPTVNENRTYNERSLWGSRDKAPIWLLIGANMMIAGVWGVIIYLLFKVYKIKQLSKVN